MLYAVIDTNILVSALIRPDGPPGRVIEAIREGTLVPVISAAIVAEYEEVLNRPRLKLDDAAVRTLLDTMRAVGVPIYVSDQGPPDGLPDAEDWPFIAAALAARCPVITGNARHFPAKAGVVVLTAAGWVEGMGQRSA